MKFLSVCSGIEAASAAWHPLGWEPLAFSEIEPFPRAVLAHHYPGVPCHGDFTQLRGEPWIVDADVLVGGTPCQAFSVAGLRRSLDDDRGNLTLEYVRLADAIDDLRRARGDEPAILVWENVPGVLSVKDNAFGCFLAALAGDSEPYVPPRGKWTNAGLVDGPKRTVAFRVLDAQYFGVAQRRRRVFVVASSRNGFDPGEVLFEWQGVRRDTPPSRETRQGAARSAEGGSDVGRGAGSRAGLNASHWDGDFPHPTLNQSASGSGGVGASNQELFSQRGAYLAPAVVGALGTQCGGGKLTQQSVANGHLIGTITARMFNALGTRDVEEGAILAVTHSLRGEGFDASEDGTGRGTPLVPVAFDWPPEVADPLSASEGKTYTHEGRGNFRTHNVVPAFAFDLRGREGGAMPEGPHDTANIRAANGGSSRSYVAAATSFYAKEGSHGSGKNEEVSVTLKATSNLAAVAHHMAVRRLTPRECERLQGFSDDYTLIPWRGKPVDQCPDGPRYKALGNSMAVPCMRWIGERIKGATQ